VSPGKGAAAAAAEEGARPICTSPMASHNKYLISLIKQPMPFIFFLYIHPKMIFLYLFQFSVGLDL
jgi:hypothetical protein